MSLEQERRDEARAVRGEARAEVNNRREHWQNIITLVALVIVVIASATYVIREDRSQDAAAQASCLRGELLRAYVRTDNALALEQLASGYRLDPELIRQQTAARRALFSTGAFDKDQCQ